MIVVTGANGKLGSAVVATLLRHIPDSQVAVSVHKPEEAKLPRGVDIRQGDYDDPESLYRSFRGAKRLLFISSSGIDHEKRSARHRNAIKAAVRAEVGHVYYTSLIHQENSVAFVMKAHIDTERDLKASGLPFTILRDGVYAEAWNLYLGDVSRGEVAVPADGPLSWVSRADLGEGMARLLLEGGHVGETLNLTGAAALDIQKTAEILSRIRGQPITMRMVSENEYVARQKAAGKSEAFARQWATTYFGLGRGELGLVDPFLGRLLGRPLRTFEQVAEEHPDGEARDR